MEIAIDFKCLNRFTTGKVLLKWKWGPDYFCSCSVSNYRQLWSGPLISFPSLSEGIHHRVRHNLTLCGTALTKSFCELRFAGIHLEVESIIQMMPKRKWSHFKLSQKLGRALPKSPNSQWATVGSSCVVYPLSAFAAEVRLVWSVGLLE